MRVRYYNCYLFTGRASDPLELDFTVEDGVVVPDTLHVDKEVDLQGGFVTPVLLDTHTHPSYVAQTLSALACTPPFVRSIEDMVTGLRDQADMTAENPEQWVEGWGYDESLLEEGRSPTRADLDRVSTTRPVFVRRSDCHSAVVNSFLLKAAGITRDTPDPAGGHIGRDKTGEPDGRLIETSAVRMVESLRADESFEARVRFLSGLTEHYLSRGIGFVTEMMCQRGAQDLLPVWRAVREQGSPLSMALYLTWTGGADPFGMPDFTEDDKTGPVRYAGLKLFADGSISGRTAALRGAFLPKEGDEHPQGTMCLAEDVFKAGLAWARRNDVQLSVHVMGDRSIDTVLDWLEGEAPWREGEPSVRLEHVSLLRPDQIDRIEKMPIQPGLTTQVIFPFAEWKGYEEVLPRDIFHASYAVRTISERCEAFALSSDAPATTWSDPDQPFVSIRAAVERRDARDEPFGVDQAVSIETALSLYTSRAAKVTTFATKGLMVPGEPAHFVLWNQNPFEVPVSRLDRVRAEKVWMHGEVVWENDGDEENVSEE